MLAFKETVLRLLASLLCLAQPALSAKIRAGEGHNLTSVLTFGGTYFVDITFDSLEYEPLTEELIQEYKKLHFVSQLQIPNNSTSEIDAFVSNFTYVKRAAFLQFNEHAGLRSGMDQGRADALFPDGNLTYPLRVGLSTILPGRNYPAEQRDIEYRVSQRVYVPPMSINIVEAYTEWVSDLVLPFKAVAKIRSAYYGGSWIMFKYSNDSCESMGNCALDCLDDNTCTCCNFQFGGGGSWDKPNVPAGCTRDFVQLKGNNATYLGDQNKDALFEFTGKFIGSFQHLGLRVNQTIVDYVPPEL